MRARVFLAVEFELNAADEYPEEIDSWKAAAELETDLMELRVGDNDTVTFLVSSIEVDEDEPFNREVTYEA